MFAGVMDYHANVDGILWFCDTVFPRIKERLPGTRLVIAGSNPASAIQLLGKHKNIVITGFVPDMRLWYCRADVCIVPLRIARGVQNKVLEAMAMTKPVVATSQALQGISATPHQHLVVADEAKIFANTVVELLNDSARAGDLGVEARKFVISDHSWDFHMARFSSLVLRSGTVK